MSRPGRLALGLPFLVALACGRSEAPPPGPAAGPLPEPYVSAVNASPRTWHPLSQGTRAPEKLPGMVMYEVTVWPVEQPPTPEQQRAADDLVRRCRESATRHAWSDFERATADGFEPIPGDPTHFANRQYLFDEAQLDPDRPEVLMFAKTNRGRKLVGFMFYARSPEEHGEQIGGPLTLWHYHVWPHGACLDRGMIPVGRPGEGGTCASGEFGHRSPEMLHVWLIDHPQGLFSTQMTLPRKLLKKLLHAEEVEALGHEHDEHEGHEGHAGHQSDGEATGAGD